MIKSKVEFMKRPEQEQEFPKLMTSRNGGGFILLATGSSEKGIVGMVVGKGTGTCGTEYEIGHFSTTWVRAALEDFIGRVTLTGD